MKIINDLNLAPEILKALEPRRPEQGNVIHVTDLIGPPQIWCLKRTKWDEIEVPISSMLWAAVGSGLHATLEGASKHTDSGSSELTCALFISGWSLTGTLDRITFHDNTITDYKMCKAWAINNGDTIQGWTRQLNIYRYLYMMTKKEQIDKLKVQAFLRDWSAMKVRGNYPETAFPQIDIEVWTLQKTATYITKRIEMFMYAERESCTKEERWAKPDVWAVKKKGAMRAKKLFDNLFDADVFLKRQPPVHEIEHRPGDAYFRCHEYCPVNSVCKQYESSKSIWS